MRQEDEGADDGTEATPGGDAGYLAGRFLIAMPTMGDQRFERTVIYICAHNAEGAMGLVVNRSFEEVAFTDLLKQLGVERQGDEDVPILFGGPVEPGRGFVLHSADYEQDGTVKVTGDIALTATVDILRAIASGSGPERRLLALGYAGWAAGQLEGEIQENGWLIVDGDPEILFELDLAARWESAIAKLGITPAMLSTLSGSA